MRRATGLVSLAAMALGCSGGEAKLDAAAGPWSQGWVLPVEPQTGGDAERGKEILLNGSYMSCGVPVKLWENELTGPSVRTALGSTGVVGVAGRVGRNAQLPHTLNAFTTAEGADVINANSSSTLRIGASRTPATRSAIISRMPIAGR